MRSSQVLSRSGTAAASVCTLTIRSSGFFAEAAVRERATQAGGKWNPDRKVWELRYRDAAALKLATLIVKKNGIQS